MRPATARATERQREFLESFAVTTDGSGNASFRPVAANACDRRVCDGYSDGCQRLPGETSELSACLLRERRRRRRNAARPGLHREHRDRGGTPTDAGCTTSECTLREAIAASNSQAGANTIEFAIGGDTQINLTSSCPRSRAKPWSTARANPRERSSSTARGPASRWTGFGSRRGRAAPESEGSRSHDMAGNGIRVESANNTIRSNIARSNGSGIVVSGSGATGNVIGANAGPGDLFVLDFALGNVVVDSGRRRHRGERRRDRHEGGGQLRRHGSQTTTPSSATRRTGSTSKARPGTSSVRGTA